VEFDGAGGVLIHGVTDDDGALVAEDLVLWTAPILAGRNSGMSNAIIKQQGIRPSLPTTLGVRLGWALSFWVRWRARW
jgi:hypothetical protein